MRKISKVIAVVVFALMMFFGVNVLYLRHIIARATDNYLTVEEYTSSDKLLKSDGTESTKPITIFATEVKAAEDDTCFDELAEVIPAQYLNATEENAVYQYNGKEYGFYVVKEDEYFDVLLIDFVYEFIDTNHSDAEYLMRIKPVLQQTFLRVLKSNGQYTWKKVDAPLRYTYYVSNPRFLSDLKNENAYNANDAEYVFNADEGLIIMQSRVNYGNIYYMDVDDLFAEITNFMYQQFLDDFVSAFDDITAGLASASYTICGEVRHIFEMSREGSLSTNNEANIFTNQSKETQKNIIGAYSRAAGFMPKQDIILSADENSYAEFITVLNDTNYKSRLTQICEFDIVRRKKPFGNMEDVENAENLKFYKEQTLFEDKAPSFELSNEQFYNKTFDLYILPGGYQTIKFIPRYAGEYTFTVPAEVNLSINGTSYAASEDGKYTVRLNGGGQVYYITLTNNGDDVVKNAVLRCNLRELDSESVSITGLGNYAVLYRSSCDGICKVQSSNADCVVKVLDINLRELKNGNASYCYYNFQKGQQYIILVTNPTTSACSTELTIDTNAVTSYGKNTRYEIAATDQETYIKYTLSSGYHTFEYSGDLTYTGCLENVTILETADTATGVNAVMIYLDALGDVVFGFSGSGSVSFVLYAVENNYLWEVDGETYLTETATSGIYLDKSMPNRLYIQRGRSAVVKLKIGSLYFTDYVKVGDYSGISYNASTQVLTVNSNCDLINDSGSDKQYLLCMCNNYEIAVLQIYVTSEFSQVTLNSYGTDTTYGINYSAISNVATDVVKATLLLGSSSRVYETTLNAAGGYIDIKPLMSTYSDVPTEFQVTLTKLTLNTVTTLYSSDTSVYRHFEVKNRVCTINQLFGGGAGTSGNPYLISSYKQLNNIREWYRTNQSDGSTYITGAYKLTCDITLSSDWTPIEHNFKGEFDGNNKNIRNLKITVGTTGNYGFFKTLNNAFISNLGIDVANIKGDSKNTNGSADLCVGALAGTATGGSIDSCAVQASGGTAGCIEVYSYTRTYVGGLVGVNNARINNCENKSVAIKGYGYLGGIAGINTMDGELNGCKNRANIYYEYDTGNGCVGGITGANTFYASVIGCSNYGTIYYAGEKKNDKDIAPYMAQIIGYNHDNGVYSGNNCSGSTDYSNLKEKAGGFLGIGTVNQKRNCSTGEVGVSE